jgi:DNA-binding response OmpR family regulator
MTIGPASVDAGPGYVAALRDRGIEAVLVAGESDLAEIGVGDMPRLALIDAALMSPLELRACAGGCSRLKLPAIALVPDDRLREIDPALEISDFVITPSRTGELVARAQRALRRVEPPDNEDVVRAGDMVINTANFEVSVGGRRVSLRFKEYELLLLMAANPGRVYSREALLNQVWSYDYLGGTRTVDVHIRRLRSKIEDAEHTFIETVWQVGYRFKDIERG